MKFSEKIEIPIAALDVTSARIGDNLIVAVLSTPNTVDFYQATDGILSDLPLIASLTLPTNSLPAFSQQGRIKLVVTGDTVRLIYKSEETAPELAGMRILTLSSAYTIVSSIIYKNDVFGNNSISYMAFNYVENRAWVKVNAPNRRVWFHLTESEVTQLEVPTGFYFGGLFVYNSKLHILHATESTNSQILAFSTLEPTGTPTLVKTIVDSIEGASKVCVPISGKIFIANSRMPSQIYNPATNTLTNVVNELVEQENAIPSRIGSFNVVDFGQYNAYDLDASVGYRVEGLMEDKVVTSSADDLISHAIAPSYSLLGNNFIYRVFLNDATGIPTLVISYLYNSFSSSSMTAVSGLGSITNLFQSPMLLLAIAAGVIIIIVVKKKKKGKDDYDEY